MFRGNYDYKQIELFSTVTEMHKNVQERLKESWATPFYEHFFCNIDEQAFACLYAKDMEDQTFPPTSSWPLKSSNIGMF